MTDPVYDGLAVMIVPCRKPGKFKVQRIGVKKNKVEVLDEITQDRTISPAHRIAVSELDRLATDISRGILKLSEPEQLRLKFE